MDLMFADLLFNQGLLVDSTALAAVALLGFLFGRRSRQAAASGDVNLLIELGRAQCIAKELKDIVQRVSAEAGVELANIVAFQSHLNRMQRGASDSCWQRLRNQADALLGPTMKLSTALSLACDELRQQQSQLTAYAGTRIDPETGLHNRRSMTEHLEALLCTHADGKRRLALGLFSIPPSDGDNDETEDHAQAMASLLEQCVRGNDIVARYSQDEFIVLMPKTPLAGAVVFAERFLRLAEQDFEFSLSGGVGEALPAETPEKLLSRADSALYSARTHDETSLYLHNGVTVRRHVFNLHEAPADGCLVAIH
jgi:diguanylate cyclase (GGDEF)-like protein